MVVDPPAYMYVYIYIDMGGLGRVEVDGYTCVCVGMHELVLM